MSNYNLLEKISSPQNLKNLNTDQLEEVAKEAREFLIETISETGGHLAPNLGTVELIIALHKTFDSPKDKIIFDIGHQAYTHKLLTGRYKYFKTLRQKNGLSGYLKRTESEHDIFGAGHVGTAVSAATGIALGRDIKNEQFHVLAVIGDGTLTNGLTFEGLNNIGEKNLDITIILNDNGFSISRSIGGFSKYLSKIKGEQSLESIFTGLGFQYFGLINGHNIKDLTNTLEKTKKIVGPKLIHISTTKGKGYELAEKNPTKYHQINPVILIK
jgi:1-deoxy-D-xylulose-5-phosphate synthase